MKIDYKARISIYFFVIATLFLIIVIKLINLQLIQKKEINQVERKVELAQRGSIFTSDNLEIALDLEYKNIIIDPLSIEDDIEERVAKIFSNNIKGLNYDSFLKEIRKLKKEKKRYYNFNKKLISLEEETNLLEALKNEKLEGKEIRNKISKIYLISEKANSRKYINHEIFETVVGYLDFENNGLYGLEHYYDNELKGKNGIYESFRSFTNTKNEYTLPHLIGKKVIEEKKDGDNLILSLNSILQFSLDETLKKVFEDYSPVTVMGIVIESDTGKVLAMDSYPKASNKSEIKNHNISNLFEPGSIFKPITVAMAINENKINENTLIHSDGFIKVRNRIVRDHDNSTKGLLPVHKIIENSGNVGLVKISQLLEVQDFYSYISNFNFGKKTKIDTSYEISNKLLTFKDFTEVRRSNISFGQGLNMTQLQILMALNATINGGKVLKPQIVEKIIDAKGNVIKDFNTEILSTPITEVTSEKIRKMLKGVVDSGTGKAAKIDGYSIGGKTGTAQKAGENGYEAGKYFSSFFTFFPAENPKYSILITVDEPQGAYYGATVALPAAREMLDKIIKYYNIIPTEEYEEKQVEEKIITTKEKLLKVEEINEILSNNLMPNLIGQTKKNILKSNLIKYNIKFNGSGKVIYQNIESGKVIDKNTLIDLKLE